MHAVARRIKPLRRIVQALRVAVAVAPSLGFLWDAVRNRPEGTYAMRRTGQRVVLRPRRDLQVARELVSKNAYDPPAPLRAALARRSPLKVLDVGANIGLFSLAALDAYGPGTHVIAVEPDPHNLALLRRNVAENAPATVEIHAAAASTEEGVVRFESGRDHESGVVGSDHRGLGVIDVPAVDFFELSVGCNLVKLDIEGGEWPLLRDARLSSLEAAAVILEWHGPAGTGEEAERLLRAAGFEVRLDAPFAPGVGALWAWRS
jgi:FkbM family methyltransferase